MAVPVGENNTSIKLVTWPGCRLGRGAGCVGSTLARGCAFIDWHIHGLLFDDRGASVGGLRGDRGRTGLAALHWLDVAAVVWWVAGVGMDQFGLKALNIRLLVYLLNLDAWFEQNGISTFVGLQLAGEKCIVGVVVVAIGDDR